MSRRSLPSGSGSKFLESVCFCKVSQLVTCIPMPGATDMLAGSSFSAPNYTGDIKIAFLHGANLTWSAISITHLANGIHGVQYYQNGTWVRASIDSDLGNNYVIGPTMTGVIVIRCRSTTLQISSLTRGASIASRIQPVVVRLVRLTTCRFPIRQNSSERSMFDEEVTSFSEVISHRKLQTITNFCNGLHDAQGFSTLG